jgi:hypothetical protein
MYSEIIRIVDAFKNSGALGGCLCCNTATCTVHGDFEQYHSRVLFSSDVVLALRSYVCRAAPIPLSSFQDQRSFCDTLQ